MLRAGELVELTRAESFGLAGTVARGTKGVILREPGLMSRGYLVRLDPAGRQVELPAEALRPSNGILSSPARSSSEAPWWRRQSAPGQKPPKALGEKVVEETPRQATPHQPTPRQPTPRPPATSTWRSAGPPARRAALSAHRPGTTQRRLPVEAVAELRRRLGRPGRPGGTPPA